MFMTTKTVLWVHLLVGLVVVGFAPFASSAEAARPRTVVTSDGELDDIDSFIRFLLYANEFDVEGLVYSSSKWHYAGDGKGTLVSIGDA